MRLAPGWTDTGDYRHTESLLLELSAPASYGNAPTRIKFHAFPFDVPKDFGPQATAHSIASVHTVQHLGTSTTTLADCAIAAEPAALFGYANGSERGYRLAIVHHERLLEIWLFGVGGLGDQSLQDALAMISSIVWTF
jgi:hypothetical protein